MIDTYNKFCDAVQKIEKTIKSCKTIAQIENCKQWMDNVWNRNLSIYIGLGVNLKDLVEVKQLLNLTYLNRRQKILNKQVILS